MKNLLLISGFLTLSLASCKKDYVCECTITDEDEIFPDQIKTITYRGKKDDVENTCTTQSKKEDNITTTCIVK